MNILNSSLNRRFILVIKANTKFLDDNPVLNLINAHAEQSMMLAYWLIGLKF